MYIVLELVNISDILNSFRVYPRNMPEEYDIKDLQETDLSFSTYIISKHESKSTDRLSCEITLHLL
jgi:hypothetical protein